LIIRGGVNLAPLEIDEVLSRAPGVRAGICVGFEHDVYGEEVGALVIPEHENVTPEDILSYCREHLPFSKSPKCIIFTEELPITSTGKYQRNKVRHLFSEYKSI
jgi:long-chain acyl-CoA synthetase